MQLIREAIVERFMVTSWVMVRVLTVRHGITDVRHRFAHPWRIPLMLHDLASAPSPAAISHNTAAVL